SGSRSDRSRYLPRILAISDICAAPSAPRLNAAEFSSTCLTVRKPGMGMVRLLRAHNQPIAPCATVLPPLVRISRIASLFCSHSGLGLPSLKYFIHSGLLLPLTSSAPGFVSAV